MFVGVFNSKLWQKSSLQQCVDPVWQVLSNTARPVSGALDSEWHASCSGPPFLPCFRAGLLGCLTLEAWSRVVSSRETCLFLIIMTVFFIVSPINYGTWPINLLLSSVYYLLNAWREKNKKMKLLKTCQNLYFQKTKIWSSPLKWPL